jgi:S1-C subfamily serine protease
MSGYPAPPPVPVPPEETPPVHLSEGSHPKQHGRLLLAMVLLVATETAIVLGISLLTGLATTLYGTRAGARRSIPTSQAQPSVDRVRQSLFPSIVTITSTGSGRQATGMGEVLTANGYIGTSEPLVRSYTNWVVTLWNGMTASAQLMGQDTSDGLAILWIPLDHLQPVPLADSLTARIGQEVVVVGNGRTEPWQATDGVLSALGRTLSAAGSDGLLTGLMEIRAPLQSTANSLLLVNLQGQLIGLSVSITVRSAAGATSTSVIYAIPSNQLAPIASRLIQEGVAAVAGLMELGIQGVNVTPQLAAMNGLTVQSGILVTGFLAAAGTRTAAQRAGLQAGDIILAFNGQTIADSAALTAALSHRTEDAGLAFTVRRGTHQIALMLSLGDGQDGSNG